MLNKFDPAVGSQPALVLSRALTEEKPLNVLILDDERFDRHRMARLCSGLDVPVDVSNASTLHAFRNELDNRPFDLILLDYLLPDGTGLDALEAVRMSSGNLNAATIMITGQGQQTVAQQAMNSGCADYITKDDLSPSAFRRAVTNALQKSDLTSQIESQNFARAEVEKVLEHFASSFARDIKPMVSRMLRQLRDLRTEDNDPRFEAIDANCIAMWEALVELERNTGTEIMASALPSRPENGSPDAGLGLSQDKRKPPSPFTKVKH